MLNRFLFSILFFLFSLNAGSEEWLVTYSDSSLCEHKICIVDTLLFMEVKNTGLMPKQMFSFILTPINDSTYICKEVLSSNPQPGIRVKNLLADKFSNSIIVIRDSLAILVKSEGYADRPYIKEKYIETELGTYDKLLIYNNQILNKIPIDSLLKIQNNVKIKTLSGVDAYAKFGNLGIRGAYIFEEEKK